MVSSDWVKVILGSGAWIDGYDYQNKERKYEIKNLLVFRAVYHTKNTIPHPIIAAILDVNLNVLQH